MVRERKRLSPLAWEAVTLLLGLTFCINPWRTMGSLMEAIVGKPIRGTRSRTRLKQSGAPREELKATLLPH